MTTSAHGMPPPPYEMGTRGVPRGTSQETAEAWTGVAAWIAFLLPASLGLWHATVAPLWRSDAVALTLLGGPPGFQGGVSSLFGQLLQVLPLGSTLSRAASFGGLALGGAGVLLFWLCLGLLQRNAPAPRLGPTLACWAAVATTLSFPWLSEGSVVGGEATAALLALATLYCAGCGARPSGAFSSARVVLLGALFAATTWESLWAALATSAALAVVLWQSGRVPTRSEALLFGAACLAVLGAGWGAAGLAPLLAPLQDLTPERTASLQGELGLERLGLSTLTSPFQVGAWLDEVGIVVLVAAAAGALWALIHSSLRAAFMPLLAILLLDTAVPGVAEDTLAAQGREGLHLLGLGAVFCAAALGLQTLSCFTQRLRLVGARPAVMLLAVLTAAVTWAGAEDALRLWGRRNREATESWTDEVLASLPPGSLVVASSEPIVRRLAAAVASGARADVVVVPLPLLGRGALASELLELEPMLALLIRELSTSGRPSEQALTVLADTRPLFVEADSSWDQRLVAHLVPGPFFARFAPHPLGRSDRRDALANQTATFERVVESALAGQRDHATLAILAQSASQQAGLLKVLGDKAEAEQLSERLEQLTRPLVPPRRPMALHTPLDTPKG